MHAIRVAIVLLGITSPLAAQKLKIDTPLPDLEAAARILAG